MINWIIFFLMNAATLTGSEFRVVDVNRILNEEPDKLPILYALARIETGTSQGSGVFISPFHLLTAHHVIEGADCHSDAFKLQTLILAGKKQYVLGRNIRCSEILFSDQTLDISLISVDRAVRDYIPISPRNVIHPYQAIFSLGYTFEGHLGYAYDCNVTLDKGIGQKAIPLSSGGSFTPQYFAMTDCIFTPGMSGGPSIAIDAAGITPRVVGLNTMVTRKQNNDSFRIESAISRLSDAYHQYSAHFKEVQDALGERNNVLR